MGRGRRLLRGVPADPRPRAGAGLLRAHPPRGDPGPAAARAGQAADRVQGRLRRRVPGHRSRSDQAAPGDRRRRPRPRRRGRSGPVDLHVPRRRRPWSAALHRRVPYGGRRRGGADRPGHDPPFRYDAAARLSQRRQQVGRARDAGPRHVRAVPESRRQRLRLRRRQGRGEPLLTSGAELEHIADLLRRAHVQDGVGWKRWRCWSDPAVVRSRRCAVLSRPRGSRSTSPATNCRCPASPRYGRCCLRCGRSRIRSR